jgi:RNA polymerase sigma-54 factor
VEQSENPEQSFFRRQVAAAKWLERIIERRKKILHEIGKFLIQRQPDFLSGESKLLQPMTLQELSEALCLHPSTVVRAVSHKYILCRQGLLPLRSFFTAGTVETKAGEASSQQVKELLRVFVTEENKHAPLSDHALSRKMQRKGISVARRTVTKYRKALKIAPASQRKLHFSK